MSMELFYRRFAERVPELRMKLKQANMTESEAGFIRKTVYSALYLSIGVIFACAAVFSKFGGSWFSVFLLSPFLFVMMFFYFLKLPDIKILKLGRLIDNELVFAGRFLVVELESGIPVYDSFRHVARNYPFIGKYFRNIVEDLDLGTNMEEALNKAVETNPSHNFRRVLWQIINSINTGANVASSLNNMIEQIVREQRIALNEYGRKLNPLAMFYMIVAVILPSIGVTMFVILVSFLSIQLTVSTLLIISGVMGFIQFLFYTAVKSSRPATSF